MYVLKYYLTYGSVIILIILVLNLIFIIQIKFTKMMYKDKYSINFKFKPIQN